MSDNTNFNELYKNQCKTDNKIKKFGIILITLLILLIPIAYLFNIVKERKNYRDEAVSLVASSWADIQILEAPEMSFMKKTGKETQKQFLPLNTYNADVIIKAEIRKKGIFKVPVYTTDVTLNGDFLNTYGNLTGKEITTSFQVKDSKGFVSDPVFKINNMPPATVFKTNYCSKINTSEKNIPFEIKYTLRGINEIYVVPGGQNNKIKISGNWKDPSFEGDFLPSERQIDNQKFEAQWAIPGIATSSMSSYHQPKAGVSLLLPVDNYRMAERTLKYAFLFLGLTFLSYFIFEITSKENKRVHPIQYYLLGGAMLIFYLLLVSISELLPFIAAYIISALMIITLTALYTYFVITKKTNIGFSALITILMILLYSFLYILLSLQDIALLIGSLGLFIIIAAIMYITRNVDWYNE